MVICLWKKKLIKFWNGWDNKDKTKDKSTKIKSKNGRTEIPSGEGDGVGF
jgi:hypothetical protein